MWNKCPQTPKSSQDGAELWNLQTEDTREKHSCLCSAQSSALSGFKKITSGNVTRKAGESLYGWQMIFKKLESTRGS